MPPGGSGEIRATLDPSGHNMAGTRVTRFFEILSNDPVNPRLRITLIANVLEQ